jgi:hypothetical protein
MAWDEPDDIRAREIIESSGGGSNNRNVMYMYKATVLLPHGRVTGAAAHTGPRSDIRSSGATAQMGATA